MIFFDLKRQRNKRLVIFEDFFHTFYRSSKDNCICRCQVRSCSAKLSRYENKVELIKDHNHLPQSEKLVKYKLTERLKNISSDPAASAKSLVTEKISKVLSVNP